MRCFLKVRIEIARIHISAAHSFSVIGWLWKFEWLDRTRLAGDVLVDALNFRSIYECTLHTYRLVAIQIEHIASTYQLVGTCSVPNGLVVYGRCHLEGDTTWEVGLDITRNDGRSRTLGCDNHVDTHGTSQLGDTSDRKFHLLAGCHDQVAKLIYDYHHVWHIFMSVGQLEPVVDVLLVILLDVSGTGFLQQVVSAIHQHTETVERSYHLGNICDDRFFLVRNCCHEMVGDAGVNAEFHLLRVDEHQFQLIRMLLI